MAVINPAMVSGLDAVLTNLKRRNAALAAGCERGIKIAALLLQRESQRLVPVDYGNLKNSAFTRMTGKGFKAVATVGYTAFYAPYVHELVGMKLKGQPRQKPHKGRYWDPQERAQAKFLEAPYRRLQPEFARIIKQNMKLVL